MPKWRLKHNVYGKPGHSVEFICSDEQVKWYSCLANPVESPQCAIKVEPEYAKSVRDALEKDQIGFQTKYVVGVVLYGFSNLMPSKGHHMTVWLAKWHFIFYDPKFMTRLLLNLDRCWWLAWICSHSTNQSNNIGCVAILVCCLGHTWFMVHLINISQSI